MSRVDEMGRSMKVRGHAARFSMEEVGTASATDVYAGPIQWFKQYRYAGRMIVVVVSGAGMLLVSIPNVLHGHVLLMHGSEQTDSNQNALIE